MGKKELISFHSLRDNYVSNSAENKKNIIYFWAIYLAILIITRIPIVKEWAPDFIEIFQIFWFVFGILLIGITFMIYNERFLKQINVYNTGIGFIMQKKGIEQEEEYMEYSDIKFYYGADYGYEEFKDCLIIKYKGSSTIKWRKFSNSKELIKNLEQYGIWGQEIFIRRNGIRKMP